MALEFDLDDHGVMDLLMRRALENLEEEYKAVIDRDSFITEREIRDLVSSAAHSVAAFDEHKTIKVLQAVPDLLTDPMLLPDEDGHYARQTILGQLRHRILREAQAFVEPLVPLLLIEQFGESPDLRTEVLAAADAVYDAYSRDGALRVPKLWAYDDWAREYDPGREAFDADPEAFLETAGRFASWCYSEGLDGLRKRFVVAVEAWRSTRLATAA
jgi:hypothetical protein